MTIRIEDREKAIKDGAAALKVKFPELEENICLSYAETMMTGIVNAQRGAFPTVVNSSPSTWEPDEQGLSWWDCFFGSHA